MAELKSKILNEKVRRIRRNFQEHNTNDNKNAELLYALEHEISPLLHEKHKIGRHCGVTVLYGPDKHLAPIFEESDCHLRLICGVISYHLEQYDVAHEHFENTSGKDNPYIVLAESHDDFDDYEVMKKNSRLTNFAESAIKRGAYRAFALWDMYNPHLDEKIDRNQYDRLEQLCKDKEELKYLKYCKGNRDRRISLGVSCSSASMSKKEDDRIL